MGKWKCVCGRFDVSLLRSQCGVIRHIHRRCVECIHVSVSVSCVRHRREVDIAHIHTFTSCMYEGIMPCVWSMSETLHASCQIYVLGASALLRPIECLKFTYYITPVHLHLSSFILSITNLPRVCSLFIYFSNEMWALKLSFPRNITMHHMHCK